MPEATRVARGLLEAVRQAAYPLTEAADAYDPLLDLVGDARFVLLGEASHGTHEFYRARAEITQRLIREKGFTAVAVEADWPDAYRVNCFVRGSGQDSSANEALGDFRRFPTWMWRNADVLADHLSGQGRPAKVVVWAHNSHLGDARATDMGAQGEWNLGQLARERHGKAVVNVGFSTYEGTVTATSNWDEPPQRKRARPALPESYEALFHDVGVPRFFLDLRDAPEHLTSGLGQQRLERAIGVIYRPETERISHYFGARLPDQFDAVLHFDETRAVEPLERTAGWESGDAPETYPVAV